MSECYPHIDLDMRISPHSPKDNGTIPPDYTILLNSIATNLEAIKNDLISNHIWKIEQDKRVGMFVWGAWTGKRAQSYDVAYEHIETYSSITTTINLDFSENVILSLLEMVHDDDTAKDYEIRTYTDYEKNGLYNLLKAETANQDTTWMQEYYKFMPAGSRLQFYFSNYTLGKRNSIVVGVEEI